MKRMNEISLVLGKLRSIQQEELELMLEWRNSPSVRKNMYTRHEISLSEHLAWWDRIKESSDQKYFMYEYKSKPRGIVAFNNIDLDNSNAYWAFYAAPDAQKGTGSKMEFLALDYAFREIKLNKLCCEVLDFNLPVVKLHEKFGFKVEGLYREQHFVDDKFVNVYSLGILGVDWNERRDDMLNKIIEFSK